MNPKSRSWVVPVVVFIVIWGVTTHAKYSVSGDEPHYLMVSQSLSADRDIELGNNYASGDGVRFGRPGLTAGPHVGDGPAGHSLPVHDIGLPILILPAYAAATRLAALVPSRALAGAHTNPGLLAYSLLGLFLIGLVALAARILETALAGFTPAVAARIATLALFLAPPILTTGFTVYPEVPALLVTAAAVWLAYRNDERLDSSRALAVVLGLGLLPWMHRKYLLFACGLLFLILWRQRSRLSAVGTGGLVRISACFVVPCVALLGWTYWAWGNWQGPLAVEVPFSIAAFRVGSLGLLLDRDCGLLTWSPLLLLFPVALWRSRREDWPLLIPAALLFLLSAAHDQWWGGWSPAARFLVPLIPLAAVPMARLLARREARGVFAIVLLAQFLLAAIAWQFPREAWPKADMHQEARLALPLVGRLIPGLPVAALGSTSVGTALLAWSALLALVALPAAFLGIDTPRHDRPRLSRAEGGGSAHP